jgi:hypothetical protein
MGGDNQRRELPRHEVEMGAHLLGVANVVFGFLQTLQDYPADEQHSPRQIGDFVH